MSDGAENPPVADLPAVVLPVVVLPVVVLGAGPVGLAAAAHLLERGLEPLVLEAGDEPAAAVREWGHVRLFSPWRYDVDAAARRLLETTGWSAPRPTALPTGAELVGDYLDPLAAALGDRVRTRQRVVAVARAGLDVTRSAGRDTAPFLVRVRDGEGRVADLLARAVLDATGTWGRRNPLGTSGLPAPGEEAAGEHLLDPLPDVLGADRELLAGRRVLVVGAGHSAATTLLDLARLARQEGGTEITWVVRGATPTRAFGGGDADGLPARGMLGDRLRAAVEEGVVHLRAQTAVEALEVLPAQRGLRVALRTPAGAEELVVDRVVPATGFRPDLAPLRELRLDLDPAVEAPRALAPLVDPEHHSCGTVRPHGADLLAHPEAGFFVVGAKSYGRAPTFLLATGYEQVRSVVAHLAGDGAAAADVHLELPETGVCSVPAPTDDADDVARATAGLDAGLATGLVHGRAGERAAAAPGGC